MIFTVREAILADIPAMHRVRLAVRENRLSGLLSIDEGSYLPFLGEYGLGWVAESADAVIGFAIVDLAQANVWALFVDPDAEARGVGRALHNQLLQGAVERGVSRLWLTTMPGTRAERFYEAAGWSRAGMVQSEIRFERDLSDGPVRMG
jgi:GNAT superfamily N-acetyltransferase